MDGKDEARETGKIQFMGSSGQPWDGVTQEDDLVMFVFSVELNGRCVKDEFERDKTRTTEKPIGTALCEAIQHRHKDVHIFRLKNSTSGNFPQIKNNLIEVVKELYACIVKTF